MSALSDQLQLRDQIKALTRQSFFTFAIRAFNVLEGQNLEHNWHVAVIAALGESIERGDKRRAVLCMPPRYLKSFMMTVAFPAWCLGRDPRTRLICCSYSGDLAEKFSLDTLRLMRSDWYRQVFPDTHISPLKATKSDFETTAGGYRYASSVGGTVTGRGADIIIIDDPLKAGEAHSLAAREASVSWFNSSVRTRLNHPKRGRIVVVAQRLHQEDLPGMLLESEGWEPIIIPAVQWQDTRYDMGPDLRPVLLRAGRVLQPDRQSGDDLALLRREMGERDFEAQYNQRPLPPGGATFKAEWLKRYECAPKPSNVEAIIQSWDTAYEDTETADYSVCTTWAMCGKDYYLLDVWRHRPKFYELEKAVYRQREKWDAKLVIVEKAGSGISLFQNIRHGSGHHWLASLVPVTSKINRAEQQQPKFERGQIWLPREAAWLPAFENELLSFPQVKHDDQVDSVTQFLASIDTGRIKTAISQAWR